jgi:aminobenzoyl-glutamate utilization protein B
MAAINRTVRPQECFYFRETNSPLQGISLGRHDGLAAAMMTSTSSRPAILGSGWSGHFSKPIAMDMFQNIRPSVQS